MYSLEEITTITPNGRSLTSIIKAYIREKNLNFIVAKGQCLNQNQSQLSDTELIAYMAEYANCAFSKVACPNLRPSPPFMAASIQQGSSTARVEFLIDLTREAETGRASKFYSKILGAFSTQVFAVQPIVSRIFFPFDLEDTVGRGLTLEPCDTGCCIIKA